MHQGRILEALRFRKDDPKDDCQGALMWSYNDTWGEVGWSIIDHYARRKASYYAVRRAAAPVKVLVRSRGQHLVTRVVNDTLKPYRAAVQYGWMRLDGRARELQRRAIAIPANGAIEVARVPLPDSTQRNPKEWLFAAMLTGEGIPDDQAIWLLAPHRDLALAQPKISTSVNNDTLIISSPVYCHGVHLEDGGHEVVQDNYFDLLPGIPRRISIILPSKTYRLEAALPVSQ
jgi:beta-mannosidase